MRRVFVSLISLAPLVCGLATASCHPGSSSSSSSSPSCPASPASASLVAARPYAMHVPLKHEARAPLLVFLHGFGGGHEQVASYFNLTTLSERHGVYLALPDGTPDADGLKFWNATDGCCNFAQLPVDDVAYLDAVLDDALARYPIDASRVYVGGYSNGGFMSHRYACERSERVAAIVSFAGVPWKDAALCKPRVPVTVLQVHGDRDQVVAYEGSEDGVTPRHNLPRHATPGAKEGMAMWARLDGCRDPTSSDDAREEVLRYTACADGSEVELWTRHGATHRLPVSQDDMDRVWSILETHSRGRGN